MSYMANKYCILYIVGYLGYVQRIRPGESPSVQDFHRGDLIEGYLDYLKVGIEVVLERCTLQRQRQMIVDYHLTC